jgi:hypothetical protein
VTRNIATIKKHFVPVAVCSYLVGDSEELKFFKRVPYAANQFNYLTAGGKVLGSEYAVGLAQSDKVLQDFAQLPGEERKPKIEKTPSVIRDKTRARPLPPPGGLRLIAYHTLLNKDDKGGLSRAPYWDIGGAGLVEKGMTFCNTMWLKEVEWRSLVPASAKKGDTFPVPARFRWRLLWTSFNHSLDAMTREEMIRSADLELTVEEASSAGVKLRLDGVAQLGWSFEEHQAAPGTFTENGVPNSYSTKAGCDLQLLGFLGYDAKTKSMVRFDVVATGSSWGLWTDFSRNYDPVKYGAAGKLGEWPFANKGRPAPRRWPYGVAFQLVTGDRPIDDVQPSAIQLFGEEAYYQKTK